MKYEIKKPDYNRSILSISSSILKNYGINANYKSLIELDEFLKNNNKNNLIFIILDCMGTNILENNLNDNSFLRRHLLTQVTSVFPPTTAAATTAFHSGKSPNETGWIGWMPYFKKYDRMIVLFKGTDFYTGEKILNSKEIMPYQTIYEKIAKNCDVSYTKIFPKKIDKNGYDNLDDLKEKIIKATQNNQKNIISVYCEEPDHTIHHNGIKGNETKKILKELNDTIENISKKINDYVMIISADHGAIDINEIYLNDFQALTSCLKRPPSIESRFISFFIKKGMKTKFKKELDKNFHGKYLLFTKNQFKKEHLLGLGKENKNIDDFLGDYMFISTSEISLRYSFNVNNELLKADHAGITKEEMMIPVIVVKGD